jgi:hypothetical protein
VVGPTTNHSEIRRWAEKHRAVPVELSAQMFDNNTPKFKLKVMGVRSSQPEGRVTSWESFFAGFDSLGLIFIGSDNGTGFHELLQVEERSPFIPQSYRSLSCLAAS